MVQDVVADGMTVEAVPTVNQEGQAYDQRTVKHMHTTMQMLGRVAIVSGGIAVSLVNIWMFNSATEMSGTAKVAVYAQIYQMALAIPAISVLGVVLAAILKRLRTRRLLNQGLSLEKIITMTDQHGEAPDPNWWILGGSLGFVIFTLTLGLSQIPFNQEIIFTGSMVIVDFFS